MACIITAYSGCRYTTVVLGPCVCWFAPGVAGCFDFDRLSAQFLSALGAVDHFVIRALLLAARFHSVLDQDIAFNHQEVVNRMVDIIHREHRPSELFPVTLPPKQK